MDDAHCFTGLDSYKHVIDSVDVVLIACAAKYHSVYLHGGVEAGKHVFVEKPHAIDPVGVRQIAAATELAKQKGLSVLSGLHSRYVPAFREAIDRIHDGAIGEIVAFEEHYERGPYNIVYRNRKLNEVEFQFSADALHLAFRRRREPIAGAQPGSGHLGDEGTNARQGAWDRRAVGLLRRNLRHDVRSSWAWFTNIHR